MNENSPTFYLRWHTDWVLKCLERKVSRDRWPRVPLTHIVPTQAKHVLYGQVPPSAVWDSLLLRRFGLRPPRSFRVHFVDAGGTQNAVGLLRRMHMLVNERILWEARQDLENLDEWQQAQFKIQILDTLPGSFIVSHALAHAMAQFHGDFAK